MRKNALLKLWETIILKANDLEKSYEEAISKINIRMFQKISCEDIKLLQKANLNKNLL